MAYIHGSMTLPSIFKTILYVDKIILEHASVDPMFALTNLCLCDLYFMVQRFIPIFFRLWSI